MEDNDDDWEQGLTHGKTVADGWTGAVMRKPLAIQKYLGPADWPTDTAMLSVSATKKNETKGKNIIEEGEEDDDEGKEH